MKLSVSVTPDEFYEHGCKKIIALGYATKAALKKRKNAGWSEYIQKLIEAEMVAEGKWPPGNPGSGVKHSSKLLQPQTGKN